MSSPSSAAPLLSPLLSKIEGVKHGFFTRRGGVSEGLYTSLNLGTGSKDDPDHVLENRRRVAAWFGAVPEALLTCYQVHSARVVFTDQPFGQGRPEADGSVVSRIGLVCAALSADCAPVLLTDPKARIVGAVHAGWKGALGGVVEAAVKTMQEKGADPSCIVAAVGPCIGPASYEVGLEFFDRFAAEDGEARHYFRPGVSLEKRLFDLPGYVLSRLHRSGVDKAEWTGHDTYGEPQMFFSNRRAFLEGEADYGRLISAIALA